MKNYDETISSVLERINKYENAKRTKRKYVYKTIAILSCFCLIVVLGISSNFSSLFFTPNNGKTVIQNTEMVQENNEKKTIYGSDDYGNIQVFIIDDNRDHMLNISDCLKEEMDTHKNTVSYAVLISGTELSGKAFAEYKYDGFTYYEYMRLLDEAQNRLSKEVEKGISVDQCKSITDEIAIYNKKMESLVNQYTAFYKHTYGSVINYLEKNYSFLNAQKPVDFNEISQDDYKMFAVVSYETIFDLAKDNFRVYLAPEGPKADVSTNRQDVLLEKVTARVLRDFKRGETIEAIVSIKMEDVLYETQISYMDSLYETKVKLMVKHGIVDYKIEKESILSNIQCVLTPSQIESLANDDLVEIIVNVCEVGTNDKLQMFGGE